MDTTVFSLFCNDISLKICRVIHFNNQALPLHEIIFDNLNQNRSLVFFYAIILLRGKLQKNNPASHEFYFTKMLFICNFCAHLKKTLKM